MWAALEAADGQPQFPAQLIEVQTAAVLQFRALQQIPDPFRRIEVRRVRRQPLQVQPRRRTLCQEVLHRLAVMDTGAVPHHQQLPRNLAQELAQERHRCLPSTGLRLDVGEELPCRRDRAHHREMIPGEGRAQHRRLGTGRVGPCHERQRVEARFVYVDEGPLLRVGFARRAGSRSTRKTATAASSRLTERVIGFWGVHRISLRMRLTWAG
jgi:hypothetical protein